MNFAELSKIKLQEFYWFFHQQPEYDVFINHLNQIDWLHESEAVDQHEFYLLEEDEKKIIEHYIGKAPKSLDQYQGEELNLRRAFRRYLHKKYNLPLTEELRLQAPDPITAGQIEKITLYYDPSLFLRKRRQWMGAGIITLLVFIILAIFFFPNSTNSRLLVDTGSLSAEVYVDSLRVGSTNRIIEGITPGPHVISVKRFGYLTNPVHKQLKMRADTTYQVKFSLIPEDKAHTGVVLFETNVKEARIFVDGKYFGNLMDYPWMNLPAGDHLISLKKPFFKVIPSEKKITVVQADTITAAFNFQVDKHSPMVRKVEASTHIVEVSSDISGADIYLNGRPTGHQTDFVLMNLSPGTYRISLQKEGYAFDPEVQTVKIKPGDAVQNVFFRSKSESEPVEISVIPASAKIFIDSKVSGIGTFKGRLKIGMHKLTVEAPPGFMPLDGMTFMVEEKSLFKKEIKLVPQFSFSHEVDDSGNISSQNTRYNTGFFERFKGFSYSSAVGPELAYYKKLNQYAWKFGFAFPYRMPPGNDALQIDFDFNYHLTHVKNVKLLIQVAVSSEKYPRTLKSMSQWRVLFNNTKLHEMHTLSEIKQMDQWHTFSWDITPYLKYGKNTIEISTTDQNKQFFLVRAVTVTNTSGKMSQ